MKKLFSWLPIVGLLLGTIAITTEITANISLPQNISSLSAVYESPVSACQYGYFVLLK